MKTLSENPNFPFTKTGPEFIEEFEELAYSLGVRKVGYTKLRPMDIYQGYSLLYSNTIVLTLEMNEELITKAPSLATNKMIMESYRDLNKITNTPKKTELIKRRKIVGSEFREK